MRYEAADIYLSVTQFDETSRSENQSTATRLGELIQETEERRGSISRDGIRLDESLPSENFPKYARWLRAAVEPAWVTGDALRSSRHRSARADAPSNFCAVNNSS